MNLIGLDIGTTSISGVLYSTKKHEILKISFIDNEFLISGEGEYIQDPNLILDKIENIINELIDFSLDNIMAMSLSSQMHGILYVDDKGDAVSPLYTWQNQRGLKIIENEKLETYLSNILGYPVYTGYGITTHYSLLLENNISKYANKFCTIGDYVCMKLSNSTVPLTDITLAHSMGICDIKTGKRSKSLEKLGDACIKYIPEISTKIEKLGEYKTIAVIQAIGDNQASFLGSVKNKDNSILLNYGTSGQISFFDKDYKNYLGYEIRPLGINEGFINVAFSLCGGNSYKILSSFFEEVVLTFSGNDNINSMKVMDNMDLDFSKKEINCMPFFLGQRGKESSNAYFTNITEANFNSHNIVKSLVMGMAKELFTFYTNLPNSKIKKLKYLVGSGNGIRKNFHLQKAVESLYMKKLYLFELQEESCLGSIIHAGKGIGFYKDYKEGSKDIVKY
ncbi:MAG: sedoheptulokinase [Pleomorphochaeta sp.]